MTVVRALLQQRHNYYRWLLIVEVIALICLRPLQQAPQPPVSGKLSPL